MAKYRENLKWVSQWRSQEKEILKHQGKVTHEVALALAESEFEKYRIVQDKLLESDFDKAIKNLKHRK